MPELPEVQTIISDLNKKIKGKTIADFLCQTPQTIKGQPLQKIRRAVIGKKISGISRLAKLIVLTLDVPVSPLITRHLITHLKMTGRFLLGAWAKKGTHYFLKYDQTDPASRFIRASFLFADKSALFFSDIRKFGRIKIATDPEYEKISAGFGPDALSKKLTPEILQKRFKNSSRPIKQVLLDQAVLAGLGNIYADDVLWHARLNPRTPAREISQEQISSIIKSARFILGRALRLRGSSIVNYRDLAGELGGYGPVRLVYQRTGLPCLRCRRPIEKCIIAARSTHFCANCQSA